VAIDSWPEIPFTHVVIMFELLELKENVKLKVGYFAFKPLAYPGGARRLPPKSKNFFLKMKK
jgi:hypothetical protein